MAKPNTGGSMKVNNQVLEDMQRIRKTIFNMCSYGKSIGVSNIDDARLRAAFATCDILIETIHLEKQSGRHHYLFGYACFIMEMLSDARGATEEGNSKLRALCMDMDDVTTFINQVEDQHREHPHLVAGTDLEPRGMIQNFN